MKESGKEALKGALWGILAELGPIGARIFGRLFASEVAAAGTLTFDKGALLSKLVRALRGDAAAEAELRVAKLLLQEGKDVHIIAEPVSGKPVPEFQVGGVATEVKRISGLGRNMAADLAQGVRQVGAGGQVIVVRPSSSPFTLTQYQEFVGAFKPQEPGVTFRVVNEADLPQLKLPR